MEPVENIEVDGQVVAVIVRGSFDRPGVSFFTPGAWSQQLAYMRHPAGRVIDPHVHNHIRREVFETNEVLILRRGRLRRIGRDLGRDLDDPGVARLGGGRLLEEPGVDVGIRDGDTLGRREVRLDAVVDDALERDREDLLTLLGDKGGLLLGLRRGEVSRDGLRADAAVGW